jgi:hypothetical protein
MLENSLYPLFLYFQIEMNMHTGPWGPPATMRAYIHTKQLNTVIIHQFLTHFPGCRDVVHFCSSSQVRKHIMAMHPSASLISTRRDNIVSR